MGHISETYRASNLAIFLLADGLQTAERRGKGRTAWQLPQFCCSGLENERGASEGAGEQLFSCSVRPAAHKLSHRTFFARSRLSLSLGGSPSPSFLLLLRGACSLARSLPLFLCGNAPSGDGGGGSARRPLRVGKPKESREQMLQILLSAGGPVWSEEQRIEGARCSRGEAEEEGAPRRSPLDCHG